MIYSSYDINNLILYDSSLGTPCVSQQAVEQDNKSNIYEHILHHNLAHSTLNPSS